MKTLFRSWELDAWGILTQRSLLGVVRYPDYFISKNLIRAVLLGRVWLSSSFWGCLESLGIIWKCWESIRMSVEAKCSWHSTIWRGWSRRNKLITGFVEVNGRRRCRSGRRIDTLDLVILIVAADKVDDPRRRTSSRGGHV